ncbi:MAG: hypothetical protein JWO32_1743, partial [Bacteroidetes bacterium]|nr:hypothetical protein [Bacteroidota bacterium]
KNITLNVYKIDYKLNVTDSFFISLGKNSVEEFLLLNSDTLHDFLNVYVQKKEKKLVHIFRFNKQFNLLANIENVDIARLNSIAAFESEIAYCKQDVYTIKIVNSDTTGKQFYLNKHTLRSETKNFEYDFKWQFPFEKKHINSAHIIMINKAFVLIYVNVTDGTKAGQWLLRIDPLKGTLLRGTRLNDKSNPGFYSCGAIWYDTISKQLFMLGQKLTVSDFNQQDNKLNIINKSAVLPYLIQIDSLGELVSREEFKVPVSDLKSNKSPGWYLLRFVKLNRIKDYLVFEMDFYKGNNTCYSFGGTITNSISLNEEKITMGKMSISTNSLIERFYVNNDKADMNGKLCVDSLSQFEKLYYKTIPFEVKASFKLDDNNAPVWLLKKSDAKGIKENFTILKPVNKAYGLILLEEINKSENPQIYIIDNSRLILSRQITPEKFELKLSTW